MCWKRFKEAIEVTVKGCRRLEVRNLVKGKEWSSSQVSFGEVKRG